MHLLVLVGGAGRRGREVESSPETGTTRLAVVPPVEVRPKTLGLRVVV
jgi:hypothetical protein